MIIKYFRINLHFILLICLFFIVTNSFAQHTILERFFIIEMEGKVHIDCVIGAGNTCAGIDLLRSEDSLANFEIIEQIGGVCGSTSSAITYNFVDENPIKDKVSYYKLRLGLSGYSYALPIQVVDVEDTGYQIRPNPADKQAIIYFKNRPNTEHTIILFNNIGMPALFQKSSNNFFELDLRNVSSGIYTFSISGTTIVGRIVVLH